MKLIRSKIAQKILARENGIVIKLKDYGQIKEALKQKLFEECFELVAEFDDNKIDEITEEIADVLEVVATIADFFDIDKETIRKVMDEKREKKGGFEQFNFVLNKGRK